MNYEEYQKSIGNSRGVGVSGHVSVPPSEEKFHSLYIGGVTRENEMGITEEAGKFQVRGAMYNQDEIYCIVLTSKLVNVNKEKINGREKIICFSYRKSDPPVAFDGFQCPPSTEREKFKRCKNCKTHILFVAMMCDKNGKPIVTDDKQPIILFVRGSGVKYKNVSDYLYKLATMDMEPFFPDSTPEKIEFEKNNINQMRVVTKITKGTTDTIHGTKTIFEFDIENENVSEKLVNRLMKYNSELVDEFDEKFDWSKLAKKTGYYFNDNANNQQSSNSQVDNQNPPSDNIFDVDNDMFPGSNESKEGGSDLGFDDDIPF